MSDPSNRCKAKPKGSSLGGPKPASKPSPASLKPPVVAPKLSKERFRKFDYTISKHEGPIEIFKAPSHRAYMVTAQSISALCVLYVGFELLVARKDRQSQAQNWHNVVFGTSCLVMSWIGVIFLRKGTNLISRITATHSNGQTLLRIRVRSLIPFRKREIVATPFEMSLSRSPVVDPAREIDERSMRIFERLAEQRAIAEMPFYKAPGKKFSLGMWQILMNVRGTFTQEHFVFLEVNKKGTLRLDITGKFAPEFVLLGKNLVPL
ncbi:hypothetical protein AJ80_04532 [Polytolypa hystricis UAMH7299]|uniref:Uncharacterized protein n=1 Tax=Polytolypa hystricis (strain UAMH7299) TaxID=1447883 RepID=A0A2B7YA62_POLH7|nr:hypothetical protein AJ80_04532 [Polytolypa hystricis UAMH7299]